MEKLHNRIICNAEPFGFGPSAAIAQIATALRPLVHHLEYVGVGHTLELQSSVGYNHIHPTAEIHTAAQPGDVFVTAMDFAMAEQAKKAGYRVIMYDALAWYWKQFPPQLTSVNLYLAQNFYGVTEALIKHVHDLPSTIITPPLVETLANQTLSRQDHLVVNFGGISNPYFEAETGQQYVQTCVDILQRLPYRISCIGSSRYQPQINVSHLTYQTLDYASAQHLLQTAAVACITPGLGNLYDLAALDKPTILLPPLNDSQGMQLRKIKQSLPDSATIDWSEIVGTSLDYTQEQEVILPQIQQYIANLGHHPDALKHFHRLLSEKIATAFDQQSRFSLRPLTDEFGSHGVNDIVEHVVTFIQSNQPARGIYQTVRKEDKEVLRLQGYHSSPLWKFNIMTNNQ